MFHDDPDFTCRQCWGIIGTVVAGGVLLTCCLGCSLLEPAFQHTLEGVRQLPPDAATPGWQKLISDFIYTLLVGATGGSALYAGVIRPRRRAREAEVRDLELVKARLERGGVTDDPKSD
jgi:hypothetical protein